MVKATELFTLFLFWSVLSNIAFVLAAVSLAKPGCQLSCGNVSTTIPYPFGIGKGCFLDEWFEIECKNTTGATDLRPFLKKPDLEVLQIQLPNGKDTRPTGFVTINNPVLSSGCRGSSPAPVDLIGSTFVFSKERNRFMIAGCNSKVTLILTQTQPQFVSVVDKCFASCSRTCCQSDIPSSLNAFDVSFNGSCTSSFLADKDWLGTHSCPSDTKDLDHVPAVLEWSVLDYSIPGLLSKERNVGFFFSCGSDYNQNDNLTLRCYCDNGYEGNPYLNTPCTGKSRFVTS